MLGSGEEAEDAVQAALASAWVARAKLDPCRPVAAYLTTVTLNTCRDQLRRRKAARFLRFGRFDSQPPLVDDEPDPVGVAGDRPQLGPVHKTGRGEGRVRVCQNRKDPGG